VLEQTAELGWITNEAAEAADTEPLRLAPPPAIGEQSLAPYFTEEVKRLLLAETVFGDDQAARFDAIFRGGLKIYTTLDPAVQLSAESSVASVLPSDGPAAALVAIDPRNGHVLAIVGGRDYYDADDPTAKFNLATQGRRQPGSAFKPFTLAAGLEADLRLDDVFDGGPVAWVPTPTGTWTVTNINGFNFPEISLREATVFSVNTVYAELMNVVGPQRVAELVSEAGIDGLEPVHSLALGTEEVTVMDMASAYGTFAAGGIHIDPVLVTRVEDAMGNVLYEQIPVVTNVVAPGIANMVTETLTEAVRRGTGQQAKIGRPVAGKTGTTEANHDAWFVGYTPELVAAVWVGFPEGNRALRSPDTPFTITGGTWPAQIWARFAVGALSGIPYGGLATGSTDQAVAFEIDLSTGFLAGPLCPRNHVATVHLDPLAVPTVVCPIHNPGGLETLSAGIVPDLADMSFHDAVALLEAAGYEATLAWAASVDTPSGSILLQVPSAGSEATPGTTVALTVSGPEPGAAIPSILGLDEDEALRRLDLIGLSGEFVFQAESEREDAIRRSGVVWAQLPAPGSPIEGPLKAWVNPVVETEAETTP
jgi:penicillin-binding protein 1A